LVGFGWIALTCIVVIISLSRVVAIQRNYNAPLKIYGDLSRTLEADDCWEGKQQINVCVGKEWYRFLSSYFLPGNRFNLTFIDQGPTSQLPQYYPSSSSDILRNFNANNLEEPSRYIPIKNCEFVIDYDPSGDGLREFPQTEWRVVASYPFLEQSRSPSPLLRAFFIPTLSDRSNRFGVYQLLTRDTLAKNSSCRHMLFEANETIRPVYPRVEVIRTAIHRGNAQPSNNLPPQIPRSAEEKEVDDSGAPNSKTKHSRQKDREI